MADATFDESTPAVRMRWMFVTEELFWKAPKARSARIFVLSGPIAP